MVSAQIHWPATATQLRTRPLWICCALVFITFATYWPVRQFGFVNYDDNQYIYANPRIPSGLTLPNIEWAFTTYATKNYHPLTWISYLLDASVFGARPQGMHVENVFLHAANAVLLFLFLFKTTGGLWRAAIAAAIFAVHPTHVESVAWISERKDVLSCFFFLLGLLAYSRYASLDARHGRLAYLAAVLFCACGLLCKSMLVTFPFVLLMLDYWPLYRFGGASPAKGDSRKFRPVTLGHAVAEKIPFFLLSVAASVLTCKAQSSITASLQAVPVSLRAENAALSYAGYLSKSLWPMNLAVLYPYRWTISSLSAIGAVALLITLTAIVLAFGRKSRYPMVGWFWFLGTLVPVIGVVQVGAQSMADRYLYIPSIGLTILIVWSLRRPAALLGRTTAAVLIGVVLATLAVVCRHQVGFWSDSENLFGHDSIVLNGAAVAEVRLGVTAAEKGDNQAAEQHYRKALAVDPGNYAAEFNLGNLLLATSPALAIEHYQAAALKQPDMAEVQVNWGVALLKLNDPAGAFSHLKLAESLDPGSYDAHYNLGRLFLLAGKLPQAREEFTGALQARPDDPAAMAGLNSAR